MSSILIYATGLIDVAAGNDEKENEMLREMRKLADELNCSLPDYEVRLIHLDTADYLEFLPCEKDPFAEDLEHLAA